MDYLVSARKWRPQAFVEVIGQQHVAKTLSNAIRQGRIAHAYLFSGGRGVGKTTMARILSKSLNCQGGPTAEPCQGCPACQAITGGHSPDVIEIDGASNRGIDEVRELREAIKYTPMQGRYRVYIIDEVHMLTKEAFNALLKTLEEPPAHAVFIMATTEVHKIPSTILSRCQHFQFRQMTRQQIIGHLQDITKKEGIHLTASGAVTLAKVADGSMRDALSLLDQAIAYSGKTVSENDLQAMLGTPSRDILMAIIKALLEHQTATALSLIKTIIDRGYDLRQFTNELVEHWRNLLMAKLVSDPETLIDLPSEEVTALCQMAASVTLEELQRLFGIFAQALEALRAAAHPRFILEMAVVKATAFPSLQSIEQLLQRLEGIEKGYTEGSSSLASGQDSRPDDSSPAESSITDTGQTLPLLRPQWEQVIEHIHQEKPSLASHLEQGTLIGLMDPPNSDIITLGYPGNADFLADLIQKEENQQIIQKTFKRLFGRSVRLKLSRLKTLPQSSKETQELKIISDPIIKEALHILGGKIVEIRDPLH